MPTLKESSEELKAIIYDFLVSPDKKYHHREVEGKYGPVVAIPGFGGKWEGKRWHNLTKDLDIHAIFTSFGNHYERIEKYADELNKLIEEKKLKNITLIGYSMGGIIAIRYAQKYGWEKVDLIITIASPFNGSPFAKLTKKIFASCIDLSPKSELLNNLRKNDIPKNKLVCLYGKWDEFVGKNAKLPNHKALELPFGGHLNIPLQIKSLQPILKKYIIGE